MNLGLLIELVEFKFLRYLIYAPIILVFISLFKNNLVLSSYNNKRNPINFSFFLIIISCLLHLPFLTISGFYQLFFIITASLTFIIQYDYKFNLRFISLIFITSFLILSSSTNFNFDLSIESLLKSNTSSLETNQHPFVFGIMALFFLFKKDYLFFFLNLIFVIISFKRIVILGLLFAIPIVFIERNNIKLLSDNRWIFLVLNIFYIYIIISFTSGVFNEPIQQLTGISIGEFTQGRNNILVELVDQFKEMNFFEKLFGMGQGYSYDLSISETKHAPHNDVLSILIDHGVVIFILFFYYIYQEKNIFPVIYTNILFLTDNTLIYTVYIFIFLLLINNYDNNKSKSYQHYT